MKNKKILWNKPTESGLADRLCDLLMMYTFAYSLNGELHTTWAQFEKRSFDTPHREIDIQFSNVVKYIKLPEKIYFDSDISKSNVDGHIIFDFYVGGGLTVENFYNKYVKGTCELDFFKKCFETTRKEFLFCDEINSHLLNLPKDFISLHIRRGDKVRNGNWNDGNFINTHELDHLDFITKKTIDLYSKLECKNLFICGDEDDKKNPFINYANSKNFNTFTTPKMPKWIQTYFDLAIMSKSKTVITSQRYSSFARFPTLIGDGEFKTVYDLENSLI